MSGKIVHDVCNRKHESPKTTQVYLDASVELKERILAKVKPHPGKPGRYRADNQLLAFLKGL
jgi:hypothetical protein